ncbi:hypothetical protein A264_11380 [Pseudomonas syringae pv. actinidiae ICMP 19071]|nr:hypothetical protein A264_11380 [Pseudomonas syringae pv. actinidiae ICMP 19071]EPM74072.1 hypothetical protein A3SO_27243 [Pseudomonas syringae pv. actinidiae ICMP 19072]
MYQQRRKHSVSVKRLSIGRRLRGAHTLQDFRKVLADITLQREVDPRFVLADMGTDLFQVREFNSSTISAAKCKRISAYRRGQSISTLTRSPTAKSGSSARPIDDALVNNRGLGDFDTVDATLIRFLAAVFGEENRRADHHVEPVNT